MTTVIRAENLSKRYTLGHTQRTHSTGTMLEKLSGCLRHFPLFKEASSSEEFWALQDISFSIQQGDRVGIIGRNGAGKSTLLKVLSRIVEPTTGKVVIKGRVASLLEVGTGFHPELTGRENIYLNGAILGMKRQEISRKFDEIIDFAGVERFLDTPVKRYSSGMYVRLAFAVAAHLEPEILIVDEVLAVGDAAFQKKCLDKMNSFGQSGMTVLFVSHNIAAIQNLCNTALLLKSGTLSLHGEVNSVVSKYMSETRQQAETPLVNRADRIGIGIIRFVSYSLHDEHGKSVGVFHTGQQAKIIFSISAMPDADIKNVVFAIGIDNSKGERMAYLSNEMAGQAFLKMAPSIRQFEVEIPKLPLVADSYQFTVYCSVDGETSDWIQNAGSFTVEPGDFYGTGRLPPVASQGNFLMDHHFNLLSY